MFSKLIRHLRLINIASSNFLLSVILASINKFDMDENISGANFTNMA